MVMNLLNLSAKNGRISSCAILVAPGTAMRSLASLRDSKGQQFAHPILHNFQSDRRFGKYNAWAVVLVRLYNSYRKADCCTTRCNTLDVPWKTMKYGAELGLNKSPWHTHVVRNPIVQISDLPLPVLNTNLPLQSSLRMKLSITQIIQRIRYFNYL